MPECDREMSIMRRPWSTSSVNDVWCTIFGGIFKILVPIRVYRTEAQNF